jgi:hypothetical protein
LLRRRHVDDTTQSTLKDFFINEALNCKVRRTTVYFRCLCDCIHRSCRADTNRSIFGVSVAVVAILIPVVVVDVSDKGTCNQRRHSFAYGIDTVHDWIRCLQVDRLLLSNCLIVVNFSRQSKISPKLILFDEKKIIRWRQRQKRK